MGKIWLPISLFLAGLLPGSQKINIPMAFWWETPSGAGLLALWTDGYGPPSRQTAEVSKTQNMKQAL